MSTTNLAAAAAILVMLPLAACGSGSSGTAAGTRDGVRMSVPDSVDTSSLTVIVDQAGLEASDTVSVYAYRTAFDEAEPSCQGDPAPVGELSVTSDGIEPVSTTLPGTPGRYWWQVIAPGYTSECGAASTIYKAVPELALSTNEASSQEASGSRSGRTGEPYKVGLTVSNDPPEDDVWPVEIVWYGPFDSTPEAVAAGCGEGAPIGATTTVQVDKQGEYAKSVAVDAPGVYRIVAHTNETTHAAAASTGCDEYSPFVAIQ